MTTPEVAQVLAQRLHFNTYGGNPVCCAGGRAVLRVVDEDGIQANAAKVCISRSNVLFWRVLHKPPTSYLLPLMLLSGVLYAIIARHLLSQMMLRDPT